MPLHVVTRGKEETPGLRDALVRAWTPFVDKIVGVEVRRRRKGGSSGQSFEPLLREVEATYDETVDGDRGEWLAKLVDMAIEIANEDAHGKRQRYAFAIVGKTITGYKAPELRPAIEEWIEAVSEEAPTRESEGVATLAAMRAWAEAASHEHVAVLKASKDMADCLSTVARANVDARGSESKARWDAEIKIAEMRMATELEIAQLNQQGKASERAWSTVEKLGEMLFPAISTLFGEKETGAPTEQEIRAVFSTREDIRDLLLAYIASNDDDAKKAIAETLRAKWKAITQNEAAAIIRAAATILGDARAGQVALWLQKIGVVGG